MKKYNPYDNRPSHAGWRRDLYDIIFEADTPTGKAFDIGLILAILGSIIVVMLDSVQSISTVHHYSLYMLEWNFTILFTIEYILRLICVRDKKKVCYQFFWYNRFAGNTAYLPYSDPARRTIPSCDTYPETVADIQDT